MLAVLLEADGTIVVRMPGPGSVAVLMLIVTVGTPATVEHKFSNARNENV